MVGHLLAMLHHGDSGWIDLTLNAQASQGAVFNPNVHIPNGSASIRFTVQTGNGINNGADGLALTIIDIDDPSNLKIWSHQHLPGWTRIWNWCSKWFLGR